MTPAGTTHYVYDLAGHLISEASGTGTIVTEYVWVDDMPLAVVANIDTSSPNLYYVHSDHLNRPIEMTDATTKAVVWDAVYWPFGQVYSISGSASNNLRFPGQYFLIEEGLYYNWYRHYDPTIGRYLEADPLGFIDGPSLYAYVKGNPVDKSDPTGRFVANATAFTELLGLDPCGPVQQVGFREICFALIGCIGITWAPPINEKGQIEIPSVVDIPYDPKVPVITRGRDGAKP